MAELFDLIRRVAKTEASVVIRGETGTGKELVAAALHDLSSRSDGPFRAINCATLTPDLLESELFGHVKGAFTGAIRDRKGLFELADKGTVFLDEVAEIPLNIQARLLRVLQEQTFVPVGGTQSVKVDVRLISATHQSLREAVQVKRFRSDLMYRIRVVPLFLPRLAEREGDVTALMWEFIHEFNDAGYRRIDGVTREAHEALLDYEWPGNVRELRNVLEYAYAVGEGSTIDIDELTPEIRGEPPPLSGEPRTAEELERKQLMDALRKTGGRKGDAAELLDISRSTLWRRLREHNIT
jgi:two-component system response regulator AtoC